MNRRATRRHKTILVTYCLAEFASICAICGSFFFSALSACSAVNLSRFLPPLCFVL